MEYTYKGKTFTSKDNKLKVMRIVFPIIAEYKKRLFAELKDIDRSLILKYERNIALLKRDIERGTERKEDVTALETQLETETEKYETDSAVQDIKNRVADVHNDVLLQMAFDEKLMSSTIKELLEGDFSVFDYGDDEFYMFSGKVLTDFFLAMKQNKVT